jgi:hypothetical protein
MPAPGIVAHRPLQQASPVAQVSPSTRHPGKSSQVATPLSPRDTQVRPQQSSAFMHTSPAARHPVAIAHIPIVQTPLQQLCAPAHG